jgi:hypothetical protein
MAASPNQNTLTFLLVVDIIAGILVSIGIVMCAFSVHFAIFELSQELFIDFGDCIFCSLLIITTVDDETFMNISSRIDGLHPMYRVVHNLLLGG